MQVALNKIIIIGGPTASGKSDLAIMLAKNLVKAEIINADSLQLYKNLPILSAQPTKSTQQLIKHHFYGILANDEKFSVAAWLNLVCEKITELQNNNITPIITGGTGMYIYNLTNGLRKIADVNEDIKLETNYLLQNKGLTYLYDSLQMIDKNFVNLIRKSDKNRIVRYYNIYQAFKISPSDYQKIPNSKFFPDDSFINLTILSKRQELENAFYARLEAMFKNGAVLEVKELLDNGVNQTYPIARTIGFKHVSEYINGKITYKEALDNSFSDTKKYAKRQVTWFKNKNNENVANLTSANMLELYNLFLEKYVK